jgi:uncharacterized membrane protein YcaP (DUF421 family)
MMNLDAFRELWHPDIPAWALVLRAIIAYGAVLILLRIAGKRQVAQMSMTELVALLLISNAVQNSMNGGDNSLAGGILLAAVLILLSTALAYATFRNPKLERLVHGRPTMLIHRGKILHEHLARELMTVRELRQILRKQEIQQLDEVEEAVLESDGYVCVLKKNEPRDLYDEQPRNDVY